MTLLVPSCAPCICSRMQCLHGHRPKNHAHVAASSSSPSPQEPCTRCRTLIIISTCVPGALDTASWNVAVSPQARKRHREGDDVAVVTDARSAKGDVGRTNSAPSSGSLQSQQSQRSSRGPLGGLDRSDRVDDPRADCHGEGCILLGSCRDAACVQDAVSVSDDGHLVLESARSMLPPIVYLFVFISSTMRFLGFSRHNTGWGHIRHS